MQTDFSQPKTVAGTQVLQPKEGAIASSGLYITSQEAWRLLLLHHLVQAGRANIPHIWSSITRTQREDVGPMPVVEKSAVQEALSAITEEQCYLNRYLSSPKAWDLLLLARKAHEIPNDVVQDAWARWSQHTGSFDAGYGKAYREIDLFWEVLEEAKFDNWNLKHPEEGHEYPGSDENKANSVLESGLENNKAKGMLDSGPKDEDKNGN